MQLRCPPLTVEQILSWADAHKARTGRWPHSGSGPILEAPGETWTAINNALVHGGRGLSKRSSLARLLEEHRDKIDNRKPPLTEMQILDWAEEHYDRTGRWPHAASGFVRNAGLLTWRAIDKALRAGHRGLPGDDSLAQLIARCGGPTQRDRLELGSFALCAV
jgi:hypothetical protein